MSGTLVTCVMDDGPHWEHRVVNLVRSLRWFGGLLALEPFVIFAVGRPSPWFLKAIRGLDAQVELVSPVWADRPFMNKSVALGEATGSRRLVVFDCDTVVVGDLGPLLGGPCDVIARPVDIDPFTGKDWIALEVNSGWDLGRDRLRATCTGRVTATYLNTGVISVGPEVRSALHANWLRSFPALDAALRSIRPGRAFYAEQLSFGAAVVATSEARLVVAPAELNWPAHLAVDPAALLLDARPRIVHYHFMCQGSRVIAPLAPPEVQECLDALAAAQEGSLVRPGSRPARDADGVRAATYAKRAL